MTSTADWYAHGLLNAFKQGYNLETDTIKAMCVDGTYTFNKGVHEFRSDITGEVTATGYTAGGQTVLNQSLTLLNNVITFNCDDPEWTITGTMTVRRVIFYVDTGNAATDILLTCHDLGENVTTTDNIFRPVLNEDGVLDIEC